MINSYTDLITVSHAIRENSGQIKMFDVPLLIYYSFKTDSQYDETILLLHKRHSFFNC